MRFSMWKLRSPPSTNSSTRKRRSFDWNAERRRVMKGCDECMRMFLSENARIVWCLRTHVFGIDLRATRRPLRSCRARRTSPEWPWPILRSTVKSVILGDGRGLESERRATTHLWTISGFSEANWIVSSDVTILIDLESVDAVTEQSEEMGRCKRISR